MRANNSSQKKPTTAWGSNPSYPDHLVVLRDDGHDVLVAHTMGVRDDIIERGPLT